MAFLPDRTFNGSVMAYRNNEKPRAAKRGTENAQQI